MTSGSDAYVRIPMPSAPVMALLGAAIVFGVYLFVGLFFGSFVVVAGLLFGYSWLIGIRQAGRNTRRPGAALVAASPVGLIARHAFWRTTTQHRPRRSFAGESSERSG